MFDIYTFLLMNGIEWNIARQRYPESQCLWCCKVYATMWTILKIATIVDALDGCQGEWSVLHRGCYWTIGWGCGSYWGPIVGQKGKARIQTSMSGMFI